MTLESYLLNHIIEEKAVLEELLRIDNTIQKTNYSYDNFINKIRSLSKINLTLEENCNFLTDGDPDTVYNILVSTSFIKNIHIDRSFVAINKWLVERTREYYQNNNMDMEISLDVEKAYNKYMDEDIGIILYGFSDFVDGMKEVVYGSSIVVIKK